MIAKPSKIGVLAALVLLPGALVGQRVQGGLVARYALDGDTSDSVGNRDGFLVGAPTFSSNVPSQLAGMSSGSILLDGVFDKMAFDVPAGDLLKNTFSVAAWVNPLVRRDSATLTVFGTRGPIDGSFDLQLGPFKRIRVDLGNGTSFQVIHDTPTVAYELGEWHHVAVTVVPGQFDVYFDGNLISSSSGPTSPLLWDENHDLAIGSYTAIPGNDAGANFKGYIDDVRIYDHQLTRDEVANLYSAVPEPGTLGAMGSLGLLVLMALRRSPGKSSSRTAARSRHSGPRGIGPVEPSETRQTVADESSFSNRKCTLALAGLALGFLGAMEAPTNAQTFAVDIEVGGAQLGPSVNTQSIGWDFSLASPVQVTDLGVFDAGWDGLTESHRVGIWKGDGTLVLEATVPSGTSGTLFEEFRYVSVEPTVLAAGNYVIGAHYTAFSTDHVLWDPPAGQADPAITFTGPRYGQGSGLPFPSVDQGAGFLHFGPNFAFAPVPEPRAMSMAFAGLLTVLAGLRWYSARSADAPSGMILGCARVGADTGGGGVGGRSSRKR